MISLALKSRGVLIFLCVLVLGITTLFFPRSTPDAGTYTYIGRTILEGGTPYRDAWDVKGPGIFFAYARLGLQPILAEMALIRNRKNT